jgi:hypothetical protein
VSEIQNSKRRGWGFLLTVVGFLVSVAFVLVFQTDYVTLTAQFVDRHVLRGLDIHPPRPGEYVGAKLQPVLLVDHVGSPEYYEIEKAYQKIDLPPKTELTFLPQPFRAGWIELRPGQNGMGVEVIMWPRACRDDGCRHDLLVRSPEGLQLFAKVYAFRLALTDRYKNGLRVLADVDGTRFFWWDGENYVLAE